MRECFVDNYKLKVHFDEDKTKCILPELDITYDDSRIKQSHKVEYLGCNPVSDRKVQNIFPEFSIVFHKFQITISFILSGAANRYFFS